MKKLLLIGALIVVLILGALYVVGCGGDDDDAVDTDDMATTTTVETLPALKVGTDPTFPPMEFYDENGVLTGFDIELMEAIADEMGRDVEFVNFGWDALLAALSTGSDELDLSVSSMTITEERQESILFSDPYFVAFQALAVPSDSTITSVDDLVAGDRVAVQRNTTGDIWAQDNLVDRGIIIMPYDGGNDCFTAMAAGEVQAVVIDNFVAAELTAQPELNAKMLGDIPTAEQENFGIATRMGNDELIGQVNVALAKVIDDGTYLRIYRDWFGTDPVMP